MIRPEILAPAGSPEALEAALAVGADAVYLGADGFHARRGAQNFSRQDLPDLVRRCHVQGAKLYLTMNTLVQEPETEAFLELAACACEAGTDAIIVQDLGMAALLRRYAPAMRLHGSTQMAVHNLSGAKMLEDLGFCRFVPARECSEEELKKIRQGTSLEMEVFVHGALCMCVSGQCYMSAMLGARSGNRGLCAQPCRLPFACGDMDHALSLKDMSLIPQIVRLQEAGIDSLKIEGRMKRPEYVAAAVTACRDALEGRPVDMEALKSVFSRSGFTDGYFTGRRGSAMFGIREKEDVQAAGKVLGQFASLYEDPRRRAHPVPVWMQFEMKPEGCSLTVKDGEGRQISVSGEAPQIAQNKPTGEERARAALGKTGGSPYRLEGLDCILEPGLMVPAAQLNGMRRQALEALGQLRGEPCPVPFQKGELPAPKTHPLPETQALRINAAYPYQVTRAMARKAGMLILPAQALAALDSDHFLWEYKDKLCASFPRMIWEENEVTSLAGKLREQGILHAQAGNLGALRLARDHGFILHGDAFLNVLNHHSLQALADMGACDITVSFEAGLWARDLPSPVPKGLTAYGHIPLMTVRNCPIRCSIGCRRCRQGENRITDRKGSQLSLRCARGSCEIENPVPFYMADRLAELKGFDFLTLRFTGEPAEACEKIWNEYQQGGKPPAAFTRGLLYRQLL